MRINSGKFKFRRLEVPMEIRPTTEKVREAIASMVSQEIDGARVLDLFAGSGAMGLELLSRGASFCHFNELSRKNASILKKNIRECQAEGLSEVTVMDFPRCLAGLNGSFDIIFLDPPYRDGFYDEAIETILERGLLAPEGVLIAEHLYNILLPDNYGNLSCVRLKKYGTIGVDVFRYH